MKFEIGDKIADWYTHMRTLELHTIADIKDGCYWVDGGIIMNNKLISIDINFTDRTYVLKSEMKEEFPERFV